MTTLKYWAAIQFIQNYESNFQRVIQFSKQDWCPSSKLLEWENHELYYKSIVYWIFPATSEIQTTEFDWYHRDSQ
jgi:hypothetical protein